MLSFTPVTVTDFVTSQLVGVKVTVAVLPAVPPAAATCTPVPAVAVTVTSWLGLVDNDIL